MYVGVCMYVHVYVCMYVCVYVRVYVYMYLGVYVCMYVYLYVRMCVCMYVYLICPMRTAYFMHYISKHHRTSDAQTEADGAVCWGGYLGLGEGNCRPSQRALLDARYWHYKVTQHKMYNRGYTGKKLTFENSKKQTVRET
jgi:hypothetical protein